MLSDIYIEVQCSCIRQNQNNSFWKYIFISYNKQNEIGGRPHF